MRNFLSILFLCWVTAACLPAHLKKYRSGSQSEAVAREDGKPTSSARSSETRERSAPPRATIYGVDKNTFRFRVKEPDVWNSALDVLLKNYNLTIVDRKSGVITTEWDSYYLGKSVYRNRISMRIHGSSWNRVNVSVHNNVEKLQDASQAGGAVGVVWLPAEDQAGEVSRLIQNMALLLGQPPPVMPPGLQIATGDQNRDHEAVSR